MAYNYSNPFAPAPATNPVRSTFAAIAGSSGGFQVLFSGLPEDVAESHLRDLLLLQPMSLPASTTQVRCMYSRTGESLGMALVQVGSEKDAERIRLEYSGQVIDGAYHITVRHLLAPTQPLATNTTSVVPLVVPAAAPAEIVQPRQQQQVRTKATGSGTNIANGNGNGTTRNGNANGLKEDQAPGLKLLRRLGKPGQVKAASPKDKQLALLAQQKANLKKAPGNQLLSRLTSSPKANTPNSHPAAKTRPKQQRLSSGNDKVGRAKVAAGKDKMEVDQVGSGKAGGKAKPKTQAELDEEMRVWERARRFGA